MIKIRIAKNLSNIFMRSIALIIAGFVFCLGAYLIEIGGIIQLNIVESQFHLSRVADSLKQQCEPAHDILSAKINWFVARRSGWAEVRKMNAEFSY